MSSQVEVQVPPWQDPGKIGLAMVFAFGFQILVLGGLTIKGAIPRLVGEKIRLYVVPIDPRDLMRGEYVILNYEISTLVQSQDRMDPELHERMGINKWQPGTPVYVSLKYQPLSNLWIADHFHAHPPREGKFIKGKFGSFLGRLEFGIESFFVQQGQGRKYEDASRQGHLVAEVFLTPDGVAQVHKLHIEPNNPRLPEKNK